MRRYVAPSHAVHSVKARNSLAMSAEEAGDVFHRARGRTLDAFSSGTARPSPWEGMVSGLRNLQPGNVRWGYAPPAGPQRRVHPGAGDRNSGRTVGKLGFQERCWEECLGEG